MKNKDSQTFYLYVVILLLFSFIPGCKEEVAKTELTGNWITSYWEVNGNEIDLEKYDFVDIRFNNNGRCRIPIGSIIQKDWREWEVDIINDSLIVNFRNPGGILNGPYNVNLRTDSVGDIILSLSNSDQKLRLWKWDPASRIPMPNF